MIIKRQFFITSLYKKLTASFLVIFLALLIGCTDTSPRLTMSYDPRTGVYYEQVEKVSKTFYGTFFSRPPAVGTLDNGYIISKIETHLMDSPTVWVVPPPGYKWVNPSDRNDMRIVPSNLSK
jgi:hypothetical protein